MTGVTDGSPGDGGTFVHGDANLTVTDLVAPGAASIDVEFTNIAREDNGATPGNMVWQGLPLQGRSFGTNDVRFHDAKSGYTRRASFGSQAEGSLFGHIQGPTGEEVGGLSTGITLPARSSRTRRMIAARPSVSRREPGIRSRSGSLSRNRRRGKHV